MTIEIGNKNTGIPMGSYSPSSGGGGGSVTDAYTKAETDELLDAKQDKLVAGSGITISGNNEIYLDRTSYINNSINYVNKDTSYGEIKNNIFYQLQNNTFDNPVDGFKSLGFNIPSEQINSFDFIVCVKLVSPYTDNNGNIMRIGLGDTEVYVDTLYGSMSGGKLRFGTKVSGTGKAFLNTDITDTQYTLLRLKHIGTDNTLRIYSLLSDIAKLPEENEWIPVGTVDWDISQYQPSIESGDLHLQELFSIGGVNITNLGEDKTYGMQSGNYYLAFTRLIVNGNIIFNGSAISNPVEATKDEYGLVKIDHSTITINSNGQLQANIPSNLTTQGNTFNGASQLVQLDSTGKLPAIDGSQLTNLPGGNISTIFEAVDVENNNSLDTFTTGGIYYFTSSTTNANKPIDDISGVLEVIPKESGDRIVQRFTRLSARYYGCWVRTALNTTGSLVWEEWEELTLPTATTTTLGGVKPDGTTITVDEDGTIHSVSSTPSNMVTTDTGQTITGFKTHKTGGAPFSGNICVTDSGSLNAGNRLLINHTSLKIADNSNDSGYYRASYGTENLFLNDNRENSNDDYFTISTNRRGGTYWLIGWNNTPATIVTNSLKRQDSFGSTSYDILDTGNFATLTPTGALKYWTGTEADYTAIATKDADTLYRTTDTNKVFLGTIQIGGNA